MPKQVDSDRFYWNGSRYVPSGTTVLPSPHLMDWAADCAVDYIENFGSALFGPDTVAEKDLLDARTAYRIKSREAMDYGTFIHWMCEQYLRNGEPEPIPAEFLIEEENESHTIQIDVELTRKFMEGFAYKTKGGKIKHTDGFYNWCKVHDLKPIAIEQKVTTDLYGGRLDLVCELDGVVTLIDFKTGKGAYYDTWKYQLAGYRNGYNENPITYDFQNESSQCVEQAPILIQHHGILKFNKDTGRINYKDFTEYQATRTNPVTLEKEKYTRNYETDLKTFMDCVNLWWSRNRGM